MSGSFWKPGCTGGALGTDSAEKLARSYIAEESRSPADMKRRCARVLQAVSSFRSELDHARKTGEPKKVPPDDRWLKLARLATDPDSRALFQRVFLDQWQLQFDHGLKGADERAFSALAAPELRSNVRANASWLKAVLARIGWFDASRYGEDASTAAWLLVQHSDHDPRWQERMLTLLQPKVKSGDFPDKYLAYLSDRVATNAGRPQLYGTQGRCVAEGKWELLPTADPSELNPRRKAVGLGTIEEYRAMFTCT